MGIASLILGIISLIIGFIPLCGAIALVPAIIGLILGIVDTILKKNKGEKIAVSVTGLVLSAIAVVVIIFWVFVFGVAASKVDVNDIDASTENWLTSLNEWSATYED